MPAILITGFEQYSKIIKVLDRVGGTWQRVKGEDGGKYLIPTPTQYQALVDAKAVTPQDNGKDTTDGKKSRKKAKP